MIFKHAYATTAGSGFVTQKAKDAIEEAILKSDFGHTNARILGVNPQTDGAVATVIAHTTAAEAGIPHFGHPLAVTMPQVGERGGKTYMVSDARSCVQAGGLQRVEENGFPKDTFAIKNATEYGFIKVRTILSAYWYNDKVNDFRFLPKTAMAVYAAWVSQNLARRFSLDGHEQMVIAVIASVFYDSLFRENEEYSEQEKQHLAGKITQTTYAKASQVLTILDQITPMKNLDDLCIQLEKIVKSDRLSGLKSGLLISVVARSWFGTSNTEIAAIALEHIPTWITMVYSAFSDRGYKGTPLAEVAKPWRGSKGEDEFIRALQAIVHKACL